MLLVRCLSEPKYCKPAKAAVAFTVGLSCAHAGIRMFGQIQLSRQQAADHDSLIFVRRNPYLWSTDALTPAGKAFIQNSNLTTLLQNLTGVSLDCPFLTPSSTKCPQAVVDSIQVPVGQLWTIWSP